MDWDELDGDSQDTWNWNPFSWDEEKKKNSDDEDNNDDDDPNGGIGELIPTGPFAN